MEIQISDNIRDLRKERDMMQEQLAEALGVSVGAGERIIENPPCSREQGGVC